jgi:hypothetical protein
MSGGWSTVTALAAALALVACGGGVSVDPAGTAPSEAGSGPPAQDEDAGACPARSGYFACGSNVCSRAIQACDDGSCDSFASIAPACGACPTCDCLTAQSTLDIQSCQDDGAGGLTFTLYQPAVEGDPCKQDSDCYDSLCENGVCECRPAGATAAYRNGQSDCCSGWYLGGTCGAQAGSPCTTHAADCYGGTCSNGTCVCVGPGGYCNDDSGCCAGATTCVQDQCR